MSRRRVPPRTSIVVLLVLVCMSTTASSAAADTSPIDALTRQVVLVVTPDWAATQGTLTAFERVPGGPWRQHGRNHTVWVGRAGCGWGRGFHPHGVAGPRKREGDGRSPAGVFAIGSAFGAAADCETGLDYRPMTGDDWCIDRPESPHYNRIVNVRDVGAAAVAGSTEPMRHDVHRDDDAYDLGFMIGHNPACERDAGSCIFAHLVADPPRPTAGCTAMTRVKLQALLRWLRKDAEPRFALMPADVAVEVAAAWGLPLPPGDGSP